MFLCLVGCVLVYSTYAYYEGEFKNGYPHGLGKLILSDLSVYQGQFQNGFFHGKGVFSIKNTPLLYDGEWEFSAKNGKGWMYYEYDNWYDGEWKNDLRHGYGVRNYMIGQKYKGQWQGNLMNGQGCMLWTNNDYYCGGWYDGLEEGFGDYTWGLIAHKKFVFPNYNWYKGNWKSGERTGAGIMHFGFESGAKLGGTWEANQKHGPGVMICGNGIVMERNPLFTDDKPGLFESAYDETSDESSESVTKKDNVLKNYQAISKHVLSKINIETLTEESIMSISKCGATIQAKQYIKLLEKNVANEPPLKIPIHNVAHEVNLSFFIQNFLDDSFIGVQEMTEISMIRVHSLVTNPESPSGSKVQSNMNFIPSTEELGTFVKNEESTFSDISFDPQEAKNLLMSFMPQLREIYKIYSTIGLNEGEEYTYEPVMIRFFLWQLYRDIALTDTGGISIVEMDQILMRNPNSCLETTHSPWEPIYFWQFLQAIVAIGLVIFQWDNSMNYPNRNGFIYFTLKSFFEKRLFPLVGKFRGNCLTLLRDLAPIDSMYNGYRYVGEPHTVRDFMKHIMMSPADIDPCYENITYAPTKTPCNGENIVILKNEVIFSNKDDNDFMESDVTEFKWLHSFKNLGKRKIWLCLCKICPIILLPNGNYDLDYRISFIEFHEILLLLSYEAVENVRIEEIKSTHAYDAVFSRLSISSKLYTAMKKRKSIQKVKPV